MLEPYHLRGRNYNSQLNRLDECINCGKNGDKAKEYKPAAYCPNYNKAGHRAEQTKFPLFTKLVEEARTQGQQRALNNTRPVTRSITPTTAGSKKNQNSNCANYSGSL